MCHNDIYQGFQSQDIYSITGQTIKPTAHAEREIEKRAAVISFPTTLVLDPLCQQTEHHLYLNPVDEAFNMNSSSVSKGNVSMDESLKTTAYQKLVESGERDRLINLLKSRLDETGWKKNLKDYAQKLVKDRGVDNVNIDDLVVQVAPVARKHVPAEVKEEIVSQIRIFLTRELNK